MGRNEPSLARRFAVYSFAFSVFHNANNLHDVIPWAPIGNAGRLGEGVEYIEKPYSGQPARGRRAYEFKAPILLIDYTLP